MRLWRRCATPVSLAGLLLFGGASAHVGGGGEQGDGAQDHGGQNGTLQVTARGLAVEPGSDGHVPCEFDLRFAGFDDASVIDRIVIAYQEHPPVVVYDDGQDVGHLLLRTGYVHELSAAQLDLAEAPANRHHLQVTSVIRGSTVEVKSKVFWLECAGATTSTGGTDPGNTDDDSDDDSDDTDGDDSDDTDDDDTAVVVSESDEPIVSTTAAADEVVVLGPAASATNAPATGGDTSFTATTGRPPTVLPSVIYNDHPSTAGPALASTGVEADMTAWLGASLIFLGGALLLISGRRREPEGARAIAARR